MRFHVTTDDHATPALKALIAAAEDMAPLYHTVGQLVQESTRDRFDAGLDPSDTAWRPSIRVKKHGGKTLKDSGDLADSINYRVESDGAYVGTPFFWAVTHQEGRTIKPKNKKALAFPGADGATVFAGSVTIPRREIFGISAADEEEMIALMDEYFGPDPSSEGGVP